MTELAIPGPSPRRSVLSHTREARAHLERSWSQLEPRTRTAIQLAALLAAVTVAYSYSLLALLENATLDTPLAYVSLVPIIALAMAAVCHRPRRAEPPIHDRQVDYIVGVPLIVAALAISLALPARLSAQFWMWRLDLLSLPMFVAGAVSIIFGVRVLWRQKLAIGFLLLAWPLPYQVLLLRVLDGCTTLTLLGLHAALRLVPVATTGPAGGGSVFEVTHHGHSFPLSVVSACSGVNGIVGFLLVGIAEDFVEGVDEGHTATV